MFARQFTSFGSRGRHRTASGAPISLQLRGDVVIYMQPRNGVGSRFDAIGHIKAGADARVRGRLPICIEDWA